MKHDFITVSSDNKLSANSNEPLIITSNGTVVFIDPCGNISVSPKIQSKPALTINSVGSITVINKKEDEDA